MRTIEDVDQFQVTPDQGVHNKELLREERGSVQSQVNGIDQNKL